MEAAVPNVSAKPKSLRFWYGGPITEFVDATPEAVLGELTRNCEFALIPTQRDAWLGKSNFCDRNSKDSQDQFSLSSTFREWDDASMSPL
jgi:hypothetical protein